MNWLFWGFVGVIFLWLIWEGIIVIINQRRGAKIAELRLAEIRKMQAEIAYKIERAEGELTGEPGPQRSDAR